MNNVIEKVDKIFALFVLLKTMIIIKNIIKTINKDLLRNSRR